MIRCAHANIHCEAVQAGVPWWQGIIFGRSHPEHHSHALMLSNTSGALETAQRALQGHTPGQIPKLIHQVGARAAALAHPTQAGAPPPIAHDHAKLCTHACSQASAWQKAPFSRLSFHAGVRTVQLRPAAKMGAQVNTFLQTRQPRLHTQ